MYAFMATLILPGPLQDSRLVPLSGVGLSLLVLLLQVLGTTHFWAAKGTPAEVAEHPSVNPQPLTEDASQARLAGQSGAGRTILLCKLVRLLCCVALLCLSIASVSGDALWLDRGVSLAWWSRFVQCEIYAYSTALALGSVLSSRHGALLASHLSFVLLLTWVVYVCRDVLPLATTTLQPADAGEGLMLWIKLLVLTEAAVVVPIVTPHPYGSYVSAGTETTNKERTASWFSRGVYSWVNETVAKAQKADHVSLDELPPLDRSDSTRELVKDTLKFLDPLQTRKSTHLLWGFMRIYRWKYALGALLVACASVTSMSWAFATRGILAWLETGDTHPYVRPWAWVAFLSVGPTLSMFFEQWYYWTMNRLSIHMEAIITELLFQHALRIRVGSEASPEGKDESSSASTEAPPTRKPQSNFLVGKLNNLITSDLVNVTEGSKEWLILAVPSPIRIGVGVAFLYNTLGWSALVGMASLLVLFPAPGYLSTWIQKFQKEMMSKTDARVQVINEVLGVARMVKLFGWERRVAEQIDERREAELKFLRKTRWLEVVNNLFNYVIPLIAMAATFATYTVIMKEQLTASKLFASYAAFILIQQQMHTIFIVIPIVTQARVSIDRIDSFLRETELLDEYTVTKDSGPDTGSASRPGRDEAVLGIKQTRFTWTDDTRIQSLASASSGRRDRRFVLHVEDELLFERGKTNLILGPTGSGKTSLLMALLGEMRAHPTGPGSFVSLPRDGGVAYAAQESWILSDTIRNNILFGAPYDEARYTKVIKQCALDRDLSLFDAGDKTEVGEKGITLSGGQKARITLARAVYSSAEILLLDDVLASLDVHTGRWVVDQCLKGDLVRVRTVLLVSHNVALVRPIADFVVALGTDGRIASHGSLDKTLQEDRELWDEFTAEKAQLKEAARESDKPEAEGRNDDTRKSGKLVVAEEIAEGQVGWNAWRLFLFHTSRFPILYWTTYALALIVTHTIMNSQTYLLGFWAAQYEDHDPSEVSVAYYLSLYGMSVVGTFTAYAVTWLVYIVGSIRTSKIIHTQLITSILGATLRWLDTTPTSRVIARCTVDIQTIDTRLPRHVLAVVELTIYMILRVAATALIAPLFIVPSVVVAVLGGWLGRIYQKTQICIKREMSNTRAPVLSHFSSAISGIVSIRAYGAQDRFKNESYLRVDRYNRASLIYHALDRWVNVRVNILGTTLSVILAIYLVYWARLSASNAGFALTMAVGFSATILQWVRLFNNMQVFANSLERVQQYLTIEKEPKPQSTGLPPAYWPASGDLRVEKLSARYSSDGPRVLHEISFEVKSGERIGIVGRTGSGKTSLTLALLRCIFTEGRVFYDGIATDSVNLDALRSNITIIPQTPELLSGTLRKNLDPFGQYDDATLNDALRSAGLFSLQENQSGTQLTLDTTIAGGGGNLSVGQRQILALARALVRQTKLLILDEATSAIDYETDAVIQRSLREALGRDVTVLTVAHRLQSIMDADKIMVLDGGRIVEYDAPRTLLEKDGGHFRTLVDDSADRVALYAQARRVWSRAAS